MLSSSHVTLECLFKVSIMQQAALELPFLQSCTNSIPLHFRGKIISFVFQCVLKAISGINHMSLVEVWKTKKSSMQLFALPFRDTMLNCLFAKSSRAFCDPVFLYKLCGIMSGLQNRASKLMPVADTSPFPWNP